MKIALVSLRADPQRGGAERYTTDLAAALAGRGHSVDLLAGRFGDAIGGVRFVPLEAHAATRARGYLKFLDSLDRHLTSHSYDIVHAMLPVRRADLYHPHAGLAADALQTHTARRGAARVLSNLGNRLNRKRQLYAQVESELLKSPQKPLVLCLSDYMKTCVLKHYPGIESQLINLPNAVDLKKFDPAVHGGSREKVRKRFNIGADKIVALLVAQDFRLKGLPQLIEAMAKVSDKLVTLVVGGDKPARFAATARKAGVGQRVIFAGITPNPAEFYAAADLVVLQTWHDTCGLVVLEGIAMGVPVITTAFAGASEMMTSGREGIVLPDPGDVAALATAINNILDGSSRESMRRNCLALRPKLSYENHLDRLEEIYRARAR